MELVGRLSNPTGPLKIVLDQDRRTVKQATSLIASPPAPKHKRVAWVAEAAKRVLADRGVPMQARNIHGAVERHLQRSVSWSSVKNALASGVRGSSARFVRVAQGRYDLAVAPIREAGVGRLDSCKHPFG